MSNGYLKIALKIDRSPLHQSNHMDISTLEDFLTYSINLMIMIIIVFIAFDFILFLLNSWRQVSSSSHTDFYQQVKDALWDKSDLVTS